MVRDIQVQHGLKQLVPSDGASATERNLDIVFVHGLGGDCLKTWTHPGSEIPWIADRAFLGNLYDSARIMTFGYNSNVFQNVTTNRVITHANDLIEGLWARRYNCNGRPLIFVAHSLGGLIVKRALILCQDEDRFKDIQEMTRSVIFMGTPHEGSDQAKNLKVAQKIVSLVHAGQDMEKVTKELQAYSETTMDINKSFMRKASRNLTLLCFYETVPTRLPYGERMIVHQASAELNGNGARNIGMPCNHQQLCKFSSRNDSRFELIFWPQFQIVVNEALKYVAERRAEQLEEETMERLRKLDTPTTRPTGHEANPDTIQGLRETSVRQRRINADSLSAYDEAARQNFLASLTGFTTANFADNLVGPQPGTCTWIERHKVFWDDWVQYEESRLLFISGGAGCGKTCLAKHIRDHLRREFVQPNFVLAFFCNNTRIHKNESPILQYFIKELIMVQPAFFHQVGKRYRTLNLSTDSFHLESLMEILKGILQVKQESKIFLIIDGLDECEPTYIKQLLKSLHWIFQDDGLDSVRAANVARIAILSRPSPEIEGWARSHLQINVSTDQVKDDLSMFVESSLERMSDTRFQSLMLDSFRLTTWITALAGDSFLWADNIIKDLEQLEDISPASIWDLCRRCPRDMEEYYNQSLRDLARSNNEVISVILDLVLWQRRPLMISELLAAAGIALGKDLSSFNLIGSLQRTCSKLLRMNPGNEVAFVHHSLRELLTRSRDTKKGHKKIASICLNYVLKAGKDSNYQVQALTVSDLKPLRAALATSHPFLEYAQRALFWHIQMAGDDVRDLVPLLDTFLCGDSHYYRWWYIVGMIFDEETPNPQTPPILQTMAHHGMADLLGFTDIMEPSCRGTLAGEVMCWWFWLKALLMLQETSHRLLLYESVLERGDNACTLLHSAAFGNCLEFAYLWKKHSSEVDLEDTFGLTPLHYAVFAENKRFVALLLDWDADPLGTSIDIVSPLEFAVHGTDKAILEILLHRIPRVRPAPRWSLEVRTITGSPADDSLGSHNLLVQRQTYELFSVLFAAVKMEQEEYVRLLLDHGADPNPPIIASMNHDTIPMLHTAIDRGNDTIFDLLLDKCDLMAHSPIGNPLHHAVMERRQGYVEKIIAQSRLAGLGETYLDTLTLIEGHWPSVSLAVYFDDVNILRILLESGASPDTIRDDGSTALHIAVRMNRVTHVQLLIDQGCNVNIAQKNGLTALSNACYLSDETASHFVTTLLNADADPQADDRKGTYGPLHIAAEHGNTEVIQQLLECPTPPDINACGEEFPTPLGWALTYQQTDAVRLLLDKGANVNILYSNIGSPILKAVEGGNLEMVKIVLSHGAELRNERHNMWTPLHECAEKGDLEILKLLTRGQTLDDIDWVVGLDGKKGTALYQACLAGHFKCAMHLIKRGCKTGLRFGKDSSSLLHAAAMGGSRNIIRYLLRIQTFDINENGDGGLTPLALACSEGNRQAATTLVQKGANPAAKSPSQKSPNLSALFWCAEAPPSSAFKIAKLLLHAHQKASAFSQEDLNLALVHSVEKGCEKMAELLLRHEADPNSGMNEGIGWSCLQMAVVKGHVGITKLLLSDTRTDVLQRDYKGRTALHLACNLNRVSIIVPLLLGVAKETSALPPEVMDQLLCARDIYVRRALDYRFLSHSSHAAQPAEKSSKDKNLSKLRDLLNVENKYEDGDLNYALIGKSLVFAGDDEYAIKAYQMRCQWLEYEGDFYFDMGCTCDNCGTESLISSTRMVCRTCADLDLCENCHSLYKQGRCSERVCTGHEFLSVPPVPKEELQTNFPRPEGSEPSVSWRFARTTELANDWMDELREKYSIALDNRDDTSSNYSDFELEIPLLPCFIKCFNPFKMCTAVLQLTIN